MNTKEIITHTHPRFEEFAIKLMKMQRCTNEFEFAIEVLNTIPEADIPGTLAWCEHNGGHCDCEIIYNVILPLGDEPPRYPEELPGDARNFGH